METSTKAENCKLPMETSTTAENCKLPIINSVKELTVAKRTSGYQIKR